MSKPRILAAVCLSIASAGVSLPKAASAYSESAALATTNIFCVPLTPNSFESDSQTTGRDAIATAGSAGTIDPATCPGYGSFSGTATATAVASLRRGEMAVAAQATGGGAPTTVLSNAGGLATLRDEVTVLGTFAPFSFLAEVGLHVEGTLSGNSTVNATLILNSLHSASCVSTWETQCTLVSPGPFAFDLIANVPVDSTVPAFLLYAGLSAGAVNDGYADASHTAALSIHLLPGFTFTSDSGVLLVPEPSALALVAAGLLSVAAARRSSRRRSEGRSSSVSRGCVA